MQVKERGIAMAIILSIVTFGIYGIYWFVKITDELNTVAGTPEDTSGLKAFLFSLITLGIYNIYWYYKMGDKIDKYENTNSSKGILYLILGLLGFGIISYALIQDSINKAIAKKD